METIISANKHQLGEKAAQTGARLIRETILKNGEANIILATGASQFEMLSNLVRETVDWARVKVFHLDEYIGISENHPASFRKYLRERFANLVPVKAFHYIDGNADPQTECSRLAKIIQEHPIDVAFIGIGENGHLAFNDPPADFKTEIPYLVVSLDEDCRRQQLGEGWFPTLDDVPRSAISMSISQIMKSGAIVCSVPDERKASAVFNTLNREISPLFPSTILREHPEAYLFLDQSSASRIN